MSERSTLDAPVTRREFVEELDKIASKIDELFRSKQVSWPLIVSIGGVLVVVLGAGIVNWARVVTIEALTAGHSATVEDFRERIRGLESNLRGVSVENETQHKAIATVLNLKAQEQDRLLRLKFPEWPMPTYWPLEDIGESNAINGKK